MGWPLYVREKRLEESAMTGRPVGVTDGSGTVLHMCPITLANEYRDDSGYVIRRSKRQRTAGSCEMLNREIRPRQYIHTYGRERAAGHLRR